jgi:hypothetical protein
VLGDGATAQAIAACAASGADSIARPHGAN